MIGSVGLPEILLLTLVLILFFGAKRLPALARSLGRSRSEFDLGREEADTAESSQPEPTPNL